MNMIKSFVRGYPLLSLLLIFLFTLVCAVAMFLINVIMIFPVLLSPWLVGLVYSSIIEQEWRRSINEPFSFIRTRYYSV